MVPHMLDMLFTTCNKHLTSVLFHKQCTNRQFSCVTYVKSDVSHVFSNKTCVSVTDIEHWQMFYHIDWRTNNAKT